MQRAMQPLLEQMKPLKLRVHALATKRETRSRGEALLAKIEKEEGRLKRLIVQDIWRGNNHPLIQYSRKYGEQRHQDLWSEISCQVPKSATRYAVFEGGTYEKPDCIIARSGQCEIWEFKPDSDSGRQEGAKQIADYQRYVPMYYTERHRRSEAPEEGKGGAAFMTALVAHCMRDNEISLKANVKPCNMCEKQYVCELN